MSGKRSIDLSKVVVSEAALAKVPARLAKRYGLLPVGLDDGTLSVVLADPEALAKPLVTWASRP